MTTITAEEEYDYVTSNINTKITKIFDLYYSKIMLRPGFTNPELYFTEISTELNIDKSVVKYVFDIQLQFLKMKGIAK